MPVQNLISTCDWRRLSCCVRTKPRQTPVRNNIEIYCNSHRYVHHDIHNTIRYIYERSNVMQLGSMFICNCNNCCTRFGRFLRPSSGALRNFRSSLWWVTWDSLRYPTRRPRWMASTLSHIDCQATSRWFFLYILTYDARKPKHKTLYLLQTSQHLNLLSVNDELKNIDGS